jgi:hypothetical protein
MSHESLNTAEREALLKAAGIKTADVQALTAQEEIAQFADAVAGVVTDWENEVVEATGKTVDVSTVVAEILKRAKGDKDTALKLCDAQAKAEFDRIKLSKFDAARLGLDLAGKTEHNKNAWTRCQKIGEELKAAVRKQFRDTGGFVTAKIASSKTRKGNPELDAFLLKHGDNEQVREMAKLLNL